LYGVRSNMRKFFAVMFTAVLCGCVNIEYNGQTAAPLADDMQVAVFSDPGRITRPYTVLGQASASGDYRETGSDRLIAKLRDKAAKCGANAIIITEHQVIADDSGQISTSPKFSGSPERVDTGNSWNAISEDSDLNFANSKRHTPVTTSGSVNNFTRIIRAEFIRY